MLVTSFLRFKEYRSVNHCEASVDSALVSMAAFCPDERSKVDVGQHLLLVDEQAAVDAELRERLHLEDLRVAKHPCLRRRRRDALHDEVLPVRFLALVIGGDELFEKLLRFVIIEVISTALLLRLQNVVVRVFERVDQGSLTAAQV